VKGICAAVLVFEGLVIFFAMLVALDLTDIDDATLWTVGSGGLLVSVVLAGLLRWRWGAVVGSVFQLAVIAAGLVVPAMFFLGALFAGLWFFALYLGRTVDRAAPTQRS
jgi:hypothetical protein